MMLMKFYFLAKVRILDLKVLNAYDDILSLFDSNDVMKSYIFFFMYRMVLKPPGCFPNIFVKSSINNNTFCIGLDLNP